MNIRPYLILWFAIAFFGVLVIWGLYHKLTAPDEPSVPTTRESQPPLVERLREERERRMAEREGAATTTTSPATSPTPQP